MVAAPAALGLDTNWLARTFGPAAEAPPFSFLFDGKPPVRARPEALAEAANRPDTVVTRRTWGTGAGVIAESREILYADHGVVEWRLRFLSLRTNDSPRIGDVQFADLVLPLPPNRPVQVRWTYGERGDALAFTPGVTNVPVYRAVEFASAGGWSSGSILPYFSLEAGGQGCLVAIGGSGDWRVSVGAEPGGRVRMRAGLPAAQFRLRPDEEIRMPSCVVLPWAGDRALAHNRFRRWMGAFAAPAAAARPPLTCGPRVLQGYNEAGEAEHLAAIAAIAARTLPFDAYALGRGWQTGGWPGGAGELTPDPARFPRGLRPVADAAHAAGMRLILPFEPERVAAGAAVARAHADWLRPPALPPEGDDRDARLLDLGLPAARAWLAETLAAAVRDAGADILRIEARLPPAPFFAGSDAEDRLGLRELAHVEGLYALLDELRTRVPGLALETDGRRLDFELLRRATAAGLGRDAWADPAWPDRVHGAVAAVSAWLPAPGFGGAAADAAALPRLTAAGLVLAVEPVACATEELGRLAADRGVFAGDFYPLTGPAGEAGGWRAWQFHDPAREEGLLHVVPGPAGTPPALRFYPRGLRPTTAYRVEGLDPPAPPSLPGLEIAAAGLAVPAGETRRPVTVRYRAAP